MTSSSPSDASASPSPARFADVWIDGVTLADPRPYTYAIPEAWIGRLRPGTPVIVPFGSQRHVGGYIVALHDAAPASGRTRALEDVVAGEVLPATIRDLLPWLAETTLAPVADVLQALMPRGTLTRVRRVVHLTDSPDALRAALAHSAPGAQKLADLLLSAPSGVPLGALQQAARRAQLVLADWRRQGLVRIQTTLVAPAGKARMQRFAVLAPPPSDLNLTPRQAEITDLLTRAGEALPTATLQRLAQTDNATLQRLAAKGAIRFEMRAVRRDLPVQAKGLLGPVPTPEQAAILEAILDAPAGQAFLLHGVTGSGKTEVYLRVIAESLAAGRGAIVLVPEISLTPQTARRFQDRFGDTVTIWHSGLSDGERFDAWQRIRAGEARVVVGARSAVFAPVPDLGVVIVDEEHESSYKQDSSPRYHARRVALERGRREQATVILGSATPSFESYAAARAGQLTLLRMHRRVGDRPLPPVQIVDMREEMRQGHRGTFSRALTDALRETLARQEQAILLLNRRGYSSFVFCRECGYTCRCSRCAVAMTHHQNPAHLRCHYCDARSLVPDTCPQCHGPYIRHFGAGTQQIEEACQRLLPEARIVRVDRDTTSRKGSHATLLDAFGAGQHDILIGTQMVAKGLDFPRVTLVGVMAADAALNLPDFRAAERTFQLLAQVAGRAGRHEWPGRVVVQAYEPDHPALQAAAQHDYEGFFHHEWPDREALRWPPVCALAVAIAAGADRELTQRVAERVAASLREIPEAEVFGPHEAPLAQLRGLHRQQIFLKCTDLEPHRAAIRRATALAAHAGVRLTLDLDPYQML
ncbi:MAG: primosomal protein N' [Candidatus Sericytochromatia bacterium]|nr:primosomal protein N' [Candidatus Sericytochromatia bacterium]